MLSCTNENDQSNKGKCRWNFLNWSGVLSWTAVVLQRAGKGWLPFKAGHVSPLRLKSEVQQNVADKQALLKWETTPRRARWRAPTHLYNYKNGVSGAFASSCRNSARCCLTDSNFLRLLSFLSQLSTTVHYLLSFSFNTLNLIQICSGSRCFWCHTLNRMFLFPRFAFSAAR